MRSVSVVLPESMCAEMPMLRSLRMPSGTAEHALTGAVAGQPRAPVGAAGLAALHPAPEATRHGAKRTVDARVRAAAAEAARRLAATSMLSCCALLGASDSATWKPQDGWLEWQGVE